MYLYGAGGHAKVIIDILRDSGVSLNGLFDDNSQLAELNGYRIIGQYNDQKLNSPLIISIGNNTVRSKIARRLNITYGNAIHKSVVVSPSSTINTGSVIMQGAIVQAGTEIGSHVIINTRASVDHDCVIGDFAHISPGAVLCGHVQVGEGTWVGAGTVIIPGIKIGKWCTIGAGAVITQDITDFSTVKNRYQE